MKDSGVLTGSLSSFLSSLFRTVLFKDSAHCTCTFKQTNIDTANVKHGITDEMFLLGLLIWSRK